MKKILSLLFAATMAGSSFAQTTLWQTDTARHEFYRIPAVIAYGNNIIALSDNRSRVTDATVWGDVGSVGNISIEARYSSDCGKTWSAPHEIVTGFGNGTFDQSHGDAAVVRDRATGRMLMMCASGTTGYGRSNATPSDGYATALQVGRYYSTDGGHTWNGANVTSQIYGLFNTENNAPIKRLFFASGRICQSRLIKKGVYARVYSALTTNEGALVVYSDDFGATWQPLGGASARPAPKGDESKIEELPDGSVLLSSRMRGGRYFNIFKYDGNNEGGSWAEPVASTSVDDGTAGIGNDTNGEILVLPARASNGKKAYVALQSMPRGTQGEHPSNRERRSHVSIYWKAFDDSRVMSQTEQWIGGWQRMEVTDGYSAYSTMNVGEDGNIAFLYEDDCVRLKLGSQFTEMYNIKYRNYTLAEITGGEYTYCDSRK